MSPCKVTSEKLDKHGYVRRYDPSRYRAGERGWVLAHRLIWEEAFGPVPEGMQVHHLCGNRACLNLDHLVALTPQQHNALHTQSQKRLTCSKGHPLTKENRKLNGYTKAGTPKYTCRICTNDKQRERYEPKQTVLARHRRAMKKGKQDDQRNRGVRPTARRGRGGEGIGR